MLDWLASTAVMLVTQAPQVAVRLLSRAAATVPASSARRIRLASHLADALYRTGNKQAAGEIALRELPRAVDPDVLVSLHWTLAQYRMAAGLYAESLATLGQALRAPGSPLPSVAGCSCSPRERTSCAASWRRRTVSPRPRWRRRSR